MSFPVSHLGVATALLLVAACGDVWKRKIPNPINAALGLTGLWVQAHDRSWASMASGAAAGAVTLALLWVPWQSGRVGGGDVKVAAGASTWLGLSRLPEYLLLAALVGGIVSLVCYALSSRDARREIRMNLTNVASSASLPPVSLTSTGGRRSVPYGVAFAGSAGALLWGGHLW
ncbi:MAG TPA: A24 family peptidase [Polyangia bacterium]|nr:A24 family peptidase [Polyangia bacterium]